MLYNAASSRKENCVNGDLARNVEELRQKGAPDWGISLYLEMSGLRSQFLAHCEQHNEEKAASRWWSNLGEKILVAILIPISIALAYGLIHFLAAKLP